MLWITNFNAPVEVFIRAEASWPIGDHASNDTEAIWSVGHKHQIKITELMKTGDFQPLEVLKVEDERVQIQTSGKL